MRKDGFFSFPGLVILAEISNHKIYNAILNLYKMGYFDSFRGYSEDPSNKRFINRWYKDGPLSSFDKEKRRSHKIF